MSKTKSNKYQDLFMSLLFDGVGMLSFTIPFIGEFTDVIWAPIAAWLMTRMYKGKAGQAAGAFAFVEELIPGLDVIPTFTLMWLYTHVFKTKEKGRTIEVDP